VQGNREKVAEDFCVQFRIKTRCCLQLEIEDIQSK
jgi:hypothetical protein